MCKAVLYYTSISSGYCTIPVSLVDLQLQLQLYSCTSIQIQQRVLVALIRIAHVRRILRFIYAGKRTSGTRQRALLLILLA